jgi:hypothetical protein
MQKTKYLVISITEPHEELLVQIRCNAKKKKVSVSQYVRSLLYDTLEPVSNEKTHATRLDA